MRNRAVPSVILLIVFLVAGTASVFARQPADSTRYYIEKYNNPTHHDDLVKAYAFFESRYLDAKEQKDTAAMVYHLHYISRISYDLGFLNDSEQASVAQLQLLDAQYTDPGLEGHYRSVYNQLGRTYRNLQFNEQSNFYYKKGLALALTVLDSVVLTNNIANNYRDLNDPLNAAAYYQMSYNKSLKPFLPVEYARTLSNMYYEEARSGNPVARDSLLKAMEVRQEHGDSKGLFSSYRQLALVAADNGRPDEARTYAEKALALAQSINSGAYLEEALSLFSEISEDPMLQAYARLIDSLERIRMARQNTYASMKYNLSKEREKTLASELLHEREKNEKHLFQALGLISILIAAFVVYVLLQRFKKAKALEVYRTETRISQKVHDEVANDVYRVMTKLQTGNAPGNDLLDDLEGIYAKTRDISRESSIIELCGPFEETLTDLLLGFNAENVSIITRGIDTINWELIPEDKKRVVYRVLQELMTNMRKHSKASLVIVNFSKNGSKITVEYKDNGVGGMLHKKNGLQNAENRIHAVNGSIIFDTEPNKGLKVRFTL